MLRKEKKSNGQTRKKKKKKKKEKKREKGFTKLLEGTRECYTPQESSRLEKATRVVGMRLIRATSRRVSQVRKHRPWILA